MRSRLAGLLLAVARRVEPPLSADVRAGELFPSDAETDAAVRRLRHLAARVSEGSRDVDVVIAAFDRLRDAALERSGARLG